MLQIASGLPKTSYLKLIDVWFIFCILSDFVMVTLLVFINSYLLGHTPITCVMPLPPGKQVSRIDRLLIVHLSIFAFCYKNIIAPRIFSNMSNHA